VGKTSAWRWGNVPLPQTHLVGLEVGILLQLIASWRMPWPAWIGHACGWPLTLAGLAVTIGVALLVSGCTGETAKPTTQAGTTTTTPTAARGAVTGHMRCDSMRHGQQEGVFGDVGLVA